MKRRTIILIIGGVLVLLGVLAFIFGPYIYRDVIVGKVADAPKIEVTTPATNAKISATTAAGTWKVSNDSYAGYRVGEVLNRVHITVVGRTNSVSGDVTIVDSAISGGTITVDVASIATPEPERDSYFRSNVAETSTYPDATFTLEGPIAIPDGAFTDKKGDSMIKGTLTLHGVTKQVSIPVQAAYDGTKVQIAGSIPVAWSDYGMTAPSLGFATVEDTGSIEFLVNLTHS